MKKLIKYGIIIKEESSLRVRIQGITIWKALYVEYNGVITVATVEIRSSSLSNQWKLVAFFAFKRKGWKPMKYKLDLQLFGGRGASSSGVGDLGSGGGGGINILSTSVNP